MCFQAIMFDETFALFTASSSKSDTDMGFQSQEIALSLALMRSVVILIQLFGFSILNS